MLCLMALPLRSKMEMDLFYLRSLLHLAYMNTHEIFASPMNVLNITKVVPSVKRIFSKKGVEYV